MADPRPLIYAQDPGGANLIARVVKALAARRPLEAVVVCHPLAQPVFRRAGVDADPVSASLASLPAELAALDAWLERLEPSHLVCTASSRHADLTNARLIAAARRRGIRSLTFLDHWVGFDRFQDDAGEPAYLPDVVGVPDRYCQERVVAIGSEESAVPIVGHAHLESLADLAPPARRTGPARVLLVSQPVVFDRSFRGALFLDDHGARAIDRIAAALEPGITSGLVEAAYRPHPKEQRGGIVPPCFAVDEGEGGAALLERHDVFIGVTSMLLFEAAVARRAVIQLDVPALRQAVAGGWPPYDAGVRVTSLDGLNPAIASAVKHVREGARLPGVPGLALAGSLERSVALCESFLS